jgi:FdhD protein
VRVREVTAGVARDRGDRLATEEPLEIRLAWPGRGAHRLSVTMRTPGHDFELAAGFLYGEGLVRSDGDLHTIAYCTDHTLRREEEFNVVTVELAGPPHRTPAARYEGPTAGSAACGVCGKESVEEALAVCPAPRHRYAGQGDEQGAPPLPWKVVAELPDRLRAAQRVFDSTGGLHAAGLFDLDGEAVVVREDIGRHNAVDKVVGSRLLAGGPTGAPVLCLSGRVGFELVQKAVSAGVEVVAAVGAPSSLAVDLADRAGLCLVGFVRGDRFVVYTEHDRIGV